MVDKVISWKGKPEQIRSENGTEYIVKAIEGFCTKPRHWTYKIQKGNPMQNGYTGHLNRSYRESVLDLQIIETISQVSKKTEEFMDNYNAKHPHDSLRNIGLI